MDLIHYFIQPISTCIYIFPTNLAHIALRYWYDDAALWYYDLYEKWNNISLLVWLVGRARYTPRRFGISNIYADLASKLSSQSSSDVSYAEVTMQNGRPSSRYREVNTGILNTVAYVTASITSYTISTQCYG